ncbi:MAG: hypothetical protein K9W43_06995 [Candidatus Thorarchaeota archaeon]|nr:hypothetical protein [Candidatus Thorarchaeota archaeon]
MIFPAYMMLMLVNLFLSFTIIGRTRYRDIKYLIDAERDWSREWERQSTTVETIT